MTVEQCVAFCKGFVYAGIEYARECTCALPLLPIFTIAKLCFRLSGYCGNSFQPGSIVASTSDCNMLCLGNSSEYCGGSSR
jgi:hypothetical protein